jgi:hypothetical protein
LGNDYYRNLRNWIDEQRAIHNYSYRTLAIAINEKAAEKGVCADITYGALWGWSHKGRTGPLEDKVIAAFAAFEGITPREMRRKLRRSASEPARTKAQDEDVELVLQWLNNASLKDAAKVNLKSAQRVKQLTDSYSYSSPVGDNNSPLIKGDFKKMEQITLRAFADLRLSIVLKRSLELQELSEYSKAADRALSLLEEAGSPASLEEYSQERKVLVALIRKVSESRYRSTPVYSERYFKALTGLCFQVIGWDGDEPHLAKELYETDDFKALISDLEKNNSVVNCRPE